jgi:hypothetical protein
MSNPLQQQALQLQLRTQALAGAATNGLQMIDAAAAAAAGLAKQQQAAAEQLLQQECVPATLASREDVVQPQQQQQQHDTNAMLAAAQELSSSIRQPDTASHGNDTPCMEVDLGADPVTAGVMP